MAMSFRSAFSPSTGFGLDPAKPSRSSGLLPFPRPSTPIYALALAVLLFRGPEPVGLVRCPGET
eukprot:486740-Amorphochlora_amoeboformis.AAC.3